MPVKKKVAKKKKQISQKKVQKAPRKSSPRPLDLDSSVIELKVQLIGSKPVIWRRLQISSGSSLEQLHSAIQISMGWKNAHLFRFDVDGDTFRQPDPEYPGAYQSLQTKISQLELQEKDKFLYTYDLADSWDHEILIEKRQPNRKLTSVPVCTGGEGICPPEDSGGIRVYQETIAQKGKAKGKKQNIESNRFSLKEVNQLLQKKFKKK